MAFRYFKPDDEADEWGYGTFVDESGAETYGFDPELASALEPLPSATAENDERQLQASAAMRQASQPIAPQPVAFGPDTPAENPEWYRDDPQRVASDVAPPTPGLEPARQGRLVPNDEEQPAPARGASAFDRQLAQAAQAAGLDPRAVASLISGESGGKAQAQNPHTSARGILQFTDATWQGLTERMGTPGVRRQDLSAEEQIPYAIEYLRGAGLGPDSSPGDYKLAAISPGNTSAPDDTVLFSRETDEGKPAKAQAYRLNTWADLNQDGQVTAGEVRAVGERGYQRQPALAPPTPEQLASGQGLPPMGPPGAPQVPPAGMVQNIGPNGLAQPLPPTATPPGQLPPGLQAPPGMMLGSVTQQGVVEDPSMLATRAGAIDEAFAQQQAANLAFAQEKAAAMVDRSVQDAQNAQERRRVALERQAYMQAAVQAVERDVDELVMQPIRQVDPGRVLREMTFGRAIMFAIGAALGGASGRGKFDVGAEVDKAIERDIKAQVEAIRSGEASDRTRLAVWTRRLGSLEQGIEATRLEMREATQQYMGAIQMNRDAGVLRAEQQALNGKLEVQKQESIGKIWDSRLQTRSANFVPTPQPTPIIPASPVGTVEPPEITQRRVQQFQQLKPEQQRALLEPIAKAIKGTSMAERGLQELFDLHNIVERSGQLYVQADGRLTPLAEASLSDETIGDIGIFGGNINPFNFTPTGEGKARRHRLNAAWTELQKGARSEMPTEPPREFDEMVRAAVKPEWDSQLPAAIQSAWEMLRERRRLIEASSDPNAWAFYNYRNPSEPGVKRPTGRVTR